MAVEFSSTAGYLWLYTWILANVIQISTLNFCRRFLTRQSDPCGRQFDQMTQAARSVTANIAEGSSRHQTSTESEMRLIDVARASLNELAGDYQFLLMSHNQPAWSRHSSEWAAVHSIKIDKPDYSDDLMHDVTAYIIEQRSKFATWTDSADFTTAANALLILCARLSRMLLRQMQTILGKFKVEGGFTENLTKTRMESVKQQSSASGNPACPRCGKPMIRRMVRKGGRQGQQFWGCTDYPACTGTREE